MGNVYSTKVDKKVEPHIIIYSNDDQYIGAHLQLLPILLIFFQANAKEMNLKAKEHISTQMAIDTKVNGVQTPNTALGTSSIVMASFITGNGQQNQQQHA